MYVGEFANEYFTIAALLQGFNKETEIRRAISLGLSETHFKDPCSARMFKIIKDQHSSGINPDMNSVISRIYKDHELCQLYATIAQEQGGVLQTEVYVRGLIEEHHKIQKASQLSHLNNLMAQTDDPQERNFIWREIQKITKDDPFTDMDRNNAKLIEDFEEEVLNDLENDLVASMQGKTAGISTGIEKLDKAIYGWQKGKVYIIGARPGIGKTTLACNFGYLAAKSNTSACFFTVEMKNREIAEKLFSRAGRVKMYRFRLGDASDSDKQSLYSGIMDFRGKKLFTQDATAGLFENFEREIRRLREVNGLDFVIMDYLQLFRTRSKHTNRNSEISFMTMSLKQIAIELDIPILVLSQLNRKLEGEKREPRTSDLRDSGSIEQDADCIIFISKNEDESRYLTVAKNRGGLEGVSIPLKTDLTTNYLGE